jgi:hypothetical protein
MSIGMQKGPRIGVQKGDPGSRRRRSPIYTSFCRYGLSEDHIRTTPHDITRFRIAALSLDDYAAGRVYMAGLAHDAEQSAYDLFDALYVSGMRIHREKAKALCLKLRSGLARHFVHLMPPIVFRP